jgi:hypothetical protein
LRSFLLPRGASGDPEYGHPGYLTVVHAARTPGRNKQWQVCSHRDENSLFQLDSVSRLITPAKQRKNRFIHGESANK